MRKGWHFYVTTVVIAVLLSCRRTVGIICLGSLTATSRKIHTKQMVKPQLTIFEVRRALQWRPITGN